MLHSSASHHQPAPWQRPPLDTSHGTGSPPPMPRPPQQQQQLHLPRPPQHLPQHMPPLLVPALDMSRPPPRMPYFVREIYKNGFLKRLPHNEKKSSALSKLMRSDRFWVVFSVHDEIHPFLELWNDPTEVASKPPQYVYPLALCQHISPSIIPADSEWSFVINFETIAIRFACNSRATMDEWVDCVRTRLEEMGVLNPKGNLYSKTPLTGNGTKVVRNPMSPLPSPPVRPEGATSLTPPSATATTASAAASSLNQAGSGCAENGARNRLSIVDASDQSNQTFTTSIYLNQTPPATPQISSHAPPTTPNRQKVASSLSLDSSLNKSYETIAPPLQKAAAPSTACNNSSVYLNKASPTRHVTVIPINNKRNRPEDGGAAGGDDGSGGDLYSAIFDTETKATGTRPSTSAAAGAQRRRSPSRRQRPLSLAEDQIVGQRFSRHDEHTASRSPPKSDAKASSGVSRKLSDRRHNEAAGAGCKGGYNIQQRIRKKSQRSSSLGPLLDEHNVALSVRAARGANTNHTNSLESIDSNPRQAVPKSDRSRGAIPRRPLPLPPPPSVTAAQNDGSGQPLLGSPTRHLSELAPGIRPPPYHAHPPPSPSGFPPHIPLPGLTCQLSLPPGVSLTNPPGSSSSPEHHTRSLREQQVMRLHQEIGHPSGVRLVLRRRDCHSSLALVEFFGCLWVAGWKQREFPVLYNAFHVGDQIVSAGGVSVRTASEFQKAVKHPQQPTQQQQLHVEIIVRRLPFAQVFHLRRELDGQPLGLVTVGGTPEVREVVPGSPAAQRGMTPKVRSFDGLGLVAWVITEINGRPVSLLAKDGEAGDRLQAVGRDMSVLVQPADIAQKLRKQLKSIRGYKDYVLS